MAARYPIRAVAKLTGIPPETLRVWERRYRVVEPDRTGRGRLYDDDQVRRLSRLNQLVQRGHAIGTIASLDDSGLMALLRGPEVPSLASGPSRPGLQLLAPVLKGIDDFDETRTGDELRRLSGLMSPHDFLYEAIVPLMREVGVRWHDGKLAIAQEHLISQLVRSVLGNIRRSFRPSALARKMVFATPTGETHEFGILAAAILAGIEGIEPVYLGVDLPAHEAVRAVDRTRSNAIVLGITVPNERTASELGTLASDLPPDVNLWIGGAGAAQVDVSKMARPVSVFTDLSAFELECRHWRT